MIYVYGRSRLTIEQINNSTGAVSYLHHDQAGSTRLLTGSTGKTEGSYSYSPYGTPEHSGTGTTPLGYDGQYTSSDTGLIYLRARVYDPATAQFLSRDPLTAVTGEPYAYAGDNPLTFGDPTGLSFGSFLEEVGEGIAGWGDTLTFGATKWVREELGINNVLECSGAYEAGGIAGLATAALIPGEAELPEDASQLGHIFRSAEGHLAEDTPENRALLRETASPQNYIETNAHGNQVYAKPQSDGSEVWVEVRNGTIQNGDINRTPRYEP